jgi:ribonuclease T2
MASAAASPRDKAGEFDYWLLSLSWSPQYCVNNAGDSQCIYPLNFVVHGLWPQYERGYPDYCGRTPAVPIPLVTRMLPLMPSEKLIQHQWRKHGTCSGLDVQEYFLQVERARRAVAVPLMFADPEDYRRTSVREIEAAFAEVNRQLAPEMIAVQCSGRWLREVRICLDKDFEARACGSDVEDRCGSEVMMRPNRKPRSAP